ncbi:thioesterase [Thalassomonas viridans]|uniref:Thioesterase n=1 Tax=Thalassomonas viridans TaxID=137584 RepID=A0AAE9ZC03_9GAMM|nr:alpha/beta fold hydrolase [Thalassomonas viridans]WDE09214.1 thioesterase [Thalassomonas viridans]
MPENKWLVIPKPNPNADIKLICFPYAGGSSASYLPWLSQLPTNVELIMVQLPGRGSRVFEDAFDEMEPLVKQLLKFLPAVLNKPYILFGHSLGSRIAFELALKLKEMAHHLPAHFIASGSRGPHTALKNKIHNLPDNEFINELKKMGGTPDTLLDNNALMELLLPAIRGDFAIAEKYSYSGKETLNCPVSVLGGKDDKGITEADLKSWGNFFASPANVHMVNGNHFFIDSNKDAVLLRLNQIIRSSLLATIN